MCNRLSAVRCATAAMVLIALLVAWPAHSQPSPYQFATLAKLGQPAPNGGVLTLGFENMAINNRGEVSFGAYLPDFSEAMFYISRGRLYQIATPGQAAPGGGTFDPFGLCGGPTAINNQGDIIFSFSRVPFTPHPWVTNCGLYRYSADHGTLSAIVVPFATPAPTGGKFQGAGGLTLSLNQQRAVFGAIIATTDGLRKDNGFGFGVFEAGGFGIRKVVAPGDPSPVGPRFDYATNATSNAQGDVAFGGHLQGEVCKDLGNNPADIFCAESVFVKDRQRGEIIAIARQDRPIPPSAGGGTFDFAFGPVINERGNIVFIGALKTTPPGLALGAFRWSRGVLGKVARPGDPMPGGGRLSTTSFYTGNYDLNERDDVVFAAVLDNGQQGLYLWANGSLSLVAKTGSNLPGIGVIEHLNLLGLPTLYPGARMNDHGEILFSARLTNGEGVLVRASPR